MKYEPEPLPCPVCGNPPYVFQIEGGYNDYNTWYVVCPCSFWRDGVDVEKLVAMSKWNSNVMNYEPGKNSEPPSYLTKAKGTLEHCRQRIIELKEKYENEIRTRTP